jgi:type IV fimbrial biogenesis protein FimT
MLATLHRQHGVSLVELAIGMVILATLLAVGAPSFSGWIQSTKIRTATEAILNGIQLARAEAVRLNSPVQFVLGTDGSDTGWTVGCVTATDTCPDPIQTHTSEEGSTADIVVATDQATTVTFNGLGRMTAPAADNSIDITNPHGGDCTAAGGPMRCLRVVVTTGGQIRMCDPAVELAASPQGCN